MIKTSAKILIWPNRKSAYRPFHTYSNFLEEKHGVRQYARLQSGPVQYRRLLWGHLRCSLPIVTNTSRSNLRAISASRQRLKPRRCVFALIYHCAHQQRIPLRWLRVSQSLPTLLWKCSNACEVNLAPCPRLVPPPHLVPQDPPCASSCQKI